MTYNELKIWFRIWYKKDKRFSTPYFDNSYIIEELKTSVTFFFNRIDEDLEKNNKPSDSSRFYKGKLIEIRKQLINNGYKG